MGLRRKIIYFIRPDFRYKLYKAYGITQIAKFQMKVRGTLKMRYTLPEIHRRPADHAVYRITLFQQKLGQK